MPRGLSKADLASALKLAEITERLSRIGAHMTDAAPATESDELPFDMPARGTWEQRGGWVVNALAQDFELTLEQAAGIVGNLGYESAGFTKLQEVRPLVSGSAGGWGWPQWTGARRRAFEAWCADQNLGPSSDEANFFYVEEELDGAYASVLDGLAAETTLERCVFVVGQLYERPAGTTETHLPGFADRLAWAKRALAGARAARK